MPEITATREEGVRAAYPDYQGSTVLQPGFSGECTATPEIVAGDTGEAYFEQTRNVWTSLIFIAPLIVIYEIGVLSISSENGIAVLLKNPLSFLGQQGLQILNIVLVTVFIAAFIVHYRSSRRPIAIFVPMLAESAVYGYAFSRMVMFLMKTVDGSSFMSLSITDSVYSGLILSAGAGVYEELVFRGLLVGGLFWLLRRVFMVSGLFAIVVSVLISSALFSLAHFSFSLDGVLANFNRPLFMYRFLAGIVLSMIFLLRGLGIAVYTHTFYDVIVTFASASASSETF